MQIITTTLRGILLLLFYYSILCTKMTHGILIITEVLYDNVST